jgi:uncharacterized membrane protein YcaP (DUF421 family)
MQQEFLFQGWAGIGRTALVGVLAYAGLVAMLRVSGNRTLAKMNAFDLVVTVALGSTLATVLLSSEVALAEGLTAFAVLIALQFVVAWLAARSTWVDRLVKTEPNLLAHEGELLHRAMRRARVTAEEVRSAVRQQGLGDLAQVQAVVLETDGSFAVIPKAQAGSGAVVEGVPRVDEVGR